MSNDRMNERQKRIAKRNEKIRGDFMKMSDKRLNGKRIYTNEYIFERLSEKYTLSPVTIEKIVFYRVKYK